MTPDESLNVESVKLTVLTHFVELLLQEDCVRHSIQAKILLFVANFGAESVNAFAESDSTLADLTSFVTPNISFISFASLFLKS